MTPGNQATVRPLEMQATDLRKGLMPSTTAPVSAEVVDVPPLLYLTIERLRTLLRQPVSRLQPAPPAP